MNPHINVILKNRLVFSDVLSHNYGKIKTDSKNCFPLEETLALHNTVTVINLVFNENENQYY